MTASIRRGLPWAAGGVALIVYALTMAPSLTWAHWGADGGDFVAAAAAGRLPHPPGFPVYMALAQVAVRLPFGDPAWRLNALSAVMAAGTVVLVAMTLHLYAASHWTAFAAALSLAFASLFWSQALITEVYTSAAFFVALALFFRARGCRQGGGEWFAVGAAWGMAVSVHTTLVLLAPLWVAKRRRAWLRLALGFGVGVLPYGLLPLLGPWPQPWGDMRDLAGWWNVVSARLYWGYAFGLAWADVPRRLAAWLSLAARQFTPAGAVLVVLGVAVLWKRRRWEAAGAVMALAVLSVTAIAYGTPDSLVYLVPVLPVAAVLLGLGLARALEGGVLAWVLVLLPVALLALNWRASDVHADREAVDWLRRTLAAIPARAVLVTEGDDGQLFALWYAQEALGVRQDVLVIDRNLWWQESYRAFLYAQAGRAAAEPEDFAVGRPLCRVAAEGVVCQ